jgi:hypothetical protein
MEKHFLLCTERSGSNLIVKLLNAHSKVCGPSTKHIINPILRNLFRYGDLTNENNWNELLMDFLNLFNVDFSVWKSDFSIDEIKNNVEKGDYIGLINYIFNKEAKENGKKALFIKENQVYEFFPYLAEWFEDSKYVYQVRDPRDVALSWKKNPSHKGGVVNAAYQWKFDQQQLLKLRVLLEEKNKVISIKYEDLLTDYEFTLTRVFEFLNLEYEEKVLNFYTDSFTKKNSSTQQAWNNLSKSLIRDNSNKFLKELSSNEILAIEKICQNEMHVLGYNLHNASIDIENFDDSSITELQKEEEKLTYFPSDGVKANMIAKAKLYNKKL